MRRPAPAGWATPGGLSRRHSLGLRNVGKRKQVSTLLAPGVADWRPDEALAKVVTGESLISAGGRQAGLAPGYTGWCYSLWEFYAGERGLLILKLAVWGSPPGPSSLRGQSPMRGFDYMGEAPQV